MKNKLFWRVCLSTAFIGLSISEVAAGNADMIFRGTLIEPPPCTINDGNRVDVDFGERVGVNKIDGVNYRHLINYQIICDSATTGNLAVKLSFDGVNASFDKEAIQTSKSDLGIRVYQNDKPFTPGSSVRIDVNNPPRLEAVPVKKTEASLTEGKFEAWGTLRAEYD